MNGSKPGMSDDIIPDENRVFEKSAVGDPNSAARGSGARYNQDKVPYHMLPLDAILGLEHGTTGEWSPHEVLRYLSLWQLGCETALEDALLCSVSEVGLEGFAPAARVFEYVTKRPVRPYPKWNWIKGMNWDVPFSCAVRHLLAVIGGEIDDPETGHPHQGHVQCNLLMLLLYRRYYPEGDDRLSKWLA